MSLEDDASLDPGRKPQHWVPGYRSIIHSEEIRIRERPKGLGEGARKPRYYHPGQLDLVTGTGTGLSSLSISGRVTATPGSGPNCKHPIIAFYDFQGGSGRTLYPRPTGVHILWNEWRRFKPIERGGHFCIVHIRCFRTSSPNKRFVRKNWSSGGLSKLH
jgi:hypothetical protein